MIPQGRIKLKRYLKNHNSGNKCGFLYKIYRKLLIFKSLSAKVRSNFPSILSQPGLNSL
ncbi:hypothetical protein AVDCRST_MAG84-802 [uncultured Microcoleus sp.]|uniref:Uncharacterized protein n=1 Tax=uncultured Microcoleus sp. TaxID=259945 RepID=A0A6J4KP23_9CYAN|nr:hypothetical protein AVDCRST_MAG84-802 [uncultured Microcoleus sp.]